MTLLKYTAAQVRERQIQKLAVVGIPNSWWPLDYGNDCLAFQLERLGIRNRANLANDVISIRAFRSEYGWEEVPASEMQPGDLAAQNWSGGSIPEHIEYVYSVDPDARTITTISANTGPRPGYPKPRGVWKKERPLSAAFLFGIRPPYKDANPSKSRRADVKVIAAWLNNQDLNDLHTRADRDGIEGPLYWRMVQTWGRQQHMYGTTYKIDGVPGPRTKEVEKTILRRIRAKKK